jgi:hypothetical protein
MCGQFLCCAAWLLGVVWLFGVEWLFGDDEAAMATAPHVPAAATADAWTSATGLLSRGVGTDVSKHFRMRKR